MSRIRAAASMVIDAQPEEIYPLIADYHHGHPQIVPKKYFKSLVVESGGYGAGTVVRGSVRVAGMETRFHHIISEPAPGVLVEKDLDSGMATTFTVSPLQNGQQSNVDIVTEWEGCGVKGFFERLMNPPVMRRIYREELQQLADVVKSRRASASSVADAK
jgi:hypothetical protein